MPVLDNMLRYLLNNFAATTAAIGTCSDEIRIDVALFPENDFRCPPSSIERIEL